MSFFVCQSEGGKMLFYFGIDSKSVSVSPSTSYLRDMVYFKGEIYVGHHIDDHHIAETIHKWAFPKKLKDGTYIYHAFDGNTPDKSTLENRIRRFIWSLMLSCGNPTWRNVEHFLEWIHSLETAQSVDDLMSIICNKYCKRCKKKTSCSNDIGEDALTLAVNGYKN